MNENVFLDTNILIYAYSDSDPQKREIALDMINHSISELNLFICTHNLSEFVSTLIRLRQPISYIKECIFELSESFIISPISHSTIIEAIRLYQNYKFQWFDSIIIASAIENNCTTIFTEDFNNGQYVDKKLLIKNPFL